MSNRDPYSGWVECRYDEPLLKLLEENSTARRTIRPMDPQEVLARRHTVCSGYAALTVALCLLCEIPAYSVSGHAKSNARIGTPSAQRLGHAWVSVHLEGRWMLSDPTWASADIDDESMAQHERWDRSDELKAGVAAPRAFGTEITVDDYYYLPSAAELLSTHLPEIPQWQLLDRSKPPIDREGWDSLPKLKPSFWKAGLSPLPIPRGNADGDSEVAVAMEEAESAWKLCEASAGGNDGWQWTLQWAPWSSASDRLHCTELHRAGRRQYPAVASAFAGTSGEWEVVRFGLHPGAPKEVDLLPKVWAVSGAISTDAQEMEDQMSEKQEHENDSGWPSLASVRRQDDQFSIYVVLPTQGMYVLRVYVALGDPDRLNGQSGNADMVGRQYAHAVDFLLDASAPLSHWVDCIGCLYPRMFGAAGAVTLHAPRRRILQTGHEFNLVMELPSYAREQTLVVRDAGTGREVQLHRTTIGTLLGVPKIVNVAYAGSFRCAKSGVVTVFTRWRGERQMRAVMEFECRNDGHAPLQGTGGVMPPSNVVDDATTSIRCERLACLPVLPNTAFIQDAGEDLGLALVSHTAAAWSASTGETVGVVVSTSMPATVSAQLKEAGVPDAAQHPGVWTLVSSSDGGRRHEVELRCRRPWRYDLLIFAGERPRTTTDTAPRSLPLVVQYTVDATPTAAGDGQARGASAAFEKRQIQQFPKVFADFSSCECKLEQPRSQKLTAGPHVSVNFTLILGVECKATGVAVIQAGEGDSAPRWTHLHQELDIVEDDVTVFASEMLEASGRDAAAEESTPERWSGVVEGLQAGAVQVAVLLATAAPDETQQYRHLLEYTAE